MRSWRIDVSIGIAMEMKGDDSDTNERINDDNDLVQEVPATEKEASRVADKTIEHRRWRAITMCILMLALAIPS